MGVLIMLNNFFHDLAVAMLVASLAGAVLVSRAKSPGLEVIGPRLFRLYHRLLVISLIGIAGFGVVRAIHFQDFEWMNALGQDQITALIVKHIILGGATVAGLIYLVLARKKARS